MAAGVVARGGLRRPIAGVSGIASAPLPRYPTPHHPAAVSLPFVPFRYTQGTYNIGCSVNTIRRKSYGASCTRPQGDGVVS